MTLGAVSFSALGRPSTLAGGIPYADGSEYALLLAGIVGQVLQSNGAAAPSWGPGSAVQTTNTDTGTKNDWAPGMNGGLTIQPWNGAADLTVTGLSGLATGAIWTFKNIGTHNAFFPHLNSGSVATHQFVNPITIGNGMPVAPGGWITYYNDGTSLKMLEHNQGSWISPAFDATIFVAGAGQTWSVDAGDIVTLAYWVSGTSLLFTWYMGTTTFSGTPQGVINIKLPNGVQCGQTSLQLILFNDSGAGNTVGFGQVSIGSSFLLMEKLNGAVWNNVVNGSSFFGTIVGSMA